jgi:hypothetical protein
MTIQHLGIVAVEPTAFFVRGSEGELRHLVYLSVENVNDGLEASLMVEDDMQSADKIRRERCALRL